METEIDRVVQRLFPDELVDIEQFGDWSEEIRQDVSIEAANLISRLDDFLSGAKTACAAKCTPRKACWERFGGEGDHLIKSVVSIRSKLARDHLDAAIVTPKLTVVELRKKILAFGDLGRVRLVGDFPSDVQCLRKKLVVNGKFLGRYTIPKGIKDFVYDRTKRDGLKGHRALQFSVRVSLDGTPDSFGFEVQLMTRLQHAWDRRNHPFYEWQREHPNWEQDQEAVTLAVNDFACAETLHLVDRQANENWKTLQRFIGNGGKL
jgi:ppGpp synthetase/RelA/SpoT-type nucleotidyltranferase